MLFNHSIPGKKDLLKEFDSLGYSARVKKMAMLGRDNAQSKQYLDLLTSLLQDGTYEGHLALIGALTIKNSNIILSALKHPMASVRKTAAGFLADLASDDDIVQEIENLSQDCRQLLLRNIRKLNRRPLAERLIPLVYSRWGAHDAALLLPSCSKETIEKYLPDIGHTIVNWHVLAYRNLEVVADYFKSSLEKAPLMHKSSVWSRFSTAIRILCTEKPDFILDCAINIGPKDTIHPSLEENLGILVHKCPDKVFDLLAQNGLRKRRLLRELPNALNDIRYLSKDQWIGLGTMITEQPECMERFFQNGPRKDPLLIELPRTLLRNIRCLSKDQWIGLGRLIAEKPEHVAKLLHYIAPSERGDVFEGIYEKEARKAIIFPGALLNELPHALRESEAVRMLGLRQIRESRERIREITSFRDIDNSRELLQQAARSSNADERMQALSCLIRSTALSRCGVDETLMFLCRIKNEQDPVRSAVFTELAKYNASIYTDKHIKELTLLVDSVVDARDTSHTTRYAVQQLAFAVMIQNVSNPGGELFQFSLETTKKLTKQMGQLVFPSLEKNIPHGLEKLVFDAIYPLVANSNKRENYNVVIALAAAMGKRGHHIAQLQDLLEEAIAAKPQYIATQAVRYWLEPKETRDERVRRLLSRDKSYITIPAVFMHLHLRRQEWLDPYICGDIIRGHFLTGKTIYLLPAVNGFQRWLPRQQKTFMYLLDRIVSDNKRSHWERVNCMKIMARMPDVRPDIVFRYVNSSEIPIAEAALHAISLLEEPEKSIPILLENIDSDKARVAMYSLPRCVRLVHPDSFMLSLKELLNRDDLKVTVRKEAIRLIGAYQCRDGMALLKAELHKTNPHKDVIIAVGHAARAFLANEDAWDILSELAGSSKPDIVRSVISLQPNQLSAANKARYLEFIIRVANHPEADIRAEAFTYMRQWITGSEEVVAAATATAVVDLGYSSVWRTAMHTLVEASCDGKANEIVMRVFTDLINVEMTEDFNANAQRDLPHRQRIIAFTTLLTSLSSHIRINLAPLFQSMIAYISKDKTLQHILIKVYVASTNWNDTDSAITVINNVVECMINYPHLINSAYSEVLQNIESSKGYWEPETLLQIVDRLWHDDCHKAHYIALAILEAVGSTLNWRQDCADRLRLFRNHKDIAVTARALDIWTAIE